MIVNLFEREEGKVLSKICILGRVGGGQNPQSPQSGRRIIRDNL